MSGRDRVKGPSPPDAFFNYNNMEELIESLKIDWTKLREQKLSLLETMTLLKIEDQHTKYDHMHGLVNFIDHVQDTAVEKLGIDAIIVFGDEFVNEDIDALPADQSYRLIDGGGYDMFVALEYTDDIMKSILSGTQVHYDCDLELGKITHLTDKNIYLIELDIEGSSYTESIKAIPVKIY